MNIPLAILEPFGFTGIPMLMRADLHELIDHELRELMSRMNRLNVPYTLMCIFLKSKATYLGASNASAIYFPDSMIFEMDLHTGKMTKNWTPSHYLVDYVVAGRSFSSYIESAI